MKILLTERKYKVPLDQNSGRRRYLERVVASLNNELIEPGLTPADKARFYNSLLSAIKLAHDVQCDAKLEELETRIAELEKAREK